MALSKDKLELLETWRTLATLMGYSVNNLEGDWDEDDDNRFLHVLETIELVNKWSANPTNAFNAAMRTIEMGINSDDLDSYVGYLDDLERARLDAEKEQRIQNNPCIKSLKEDYNFAFVTSKQYPGHTHFTFKNKKGLAITGRVFKKNWLGYQIWLSWRDSKNKPQRTGWFFRSGEIRKPAGFPEDWKTQWGSLSDSSQIAQVVAYEAAAKTKFPATWDLVFPTA